MGERDRRNNLLALIGFLLVILLITVGGIFLLISSNKKENNEEQKLEEITPLIYEITKEGSNNKIYLFGSIHQAKLSEFKFPDKVMDAYNNSHYLACEVDVIVYNNNVNQTEIANKMTYTDGSKIKDHISSDLYNKLDTYLLKRNYYLETLGIYKPVFFYALIDSDINEEAGLDDSGIDEYFLRHAKQDNKTILEVETGDYQTKLLLNQPDRLYEILLSESINNYDEQVENVKNLYKAWKKGNPKELEEMLFKEETAYEAKYSIEDYKLVEKYNNELVDDRNKVMADKLMEYFEKNEDVFYMVGAAHLLGENGIASLVKSKGYNVVQLSY